MGHGKRTVSRRVKNNCFMEVNMDCIIKALKLTQEEQELTAAEMPEAEPTAEERLAIMEDAFAELCEVIFNG